jgi:hypothetical protein
MFVTGAAVLVVEVVVVVGSGVVVSEANFAHTAVAITPPFPPPCCARQVC